MLGVLEVIGITTLTAGALLVIRALVKWIIKVVKVSSVRIEAAGRWAVVTGATDGIGKAFVKALAEKGMDVVLISRTKTKLDAVALEIRDAHHVNTKVIAADFTSGDDIFDNIQKELSDLDIGVLVNNVGMANPYPERLLSLPDHERLYRDIVQCNVVGTLAMCQVVLPGMCARGRGVIINVGSMAAEMPSPLYTVYASTKAFVSKFSLDLATEYKQQGVLVHCLTPGFVATKISLTKEPSWIAPSPERYVHSALQTVGSGEKTTGYFPHSLMLFSIHVMEFFSSTFTSWLGMQITERLNKRNEGERRRN